MSHPDPYDFLLVRQERTLTLTMRQRIRLTPPYSSER